MEILKLNSKAEEDVARFKKLENRIEFLEQELADSLNVNQNLEEDAAALRSKIETRELALADSMAKCTSQEEEIIDLK